jgi:hypothetical protein
LFKVIILLQSYQRKRKKPLLQNKGFLVGGADGMLP